jgi:hypothetical protein
LPESLSFSTVEGFFSSFSPSTTVNPFSTKARIILSIGIFFIFDPRLIFITFPTEASIAGFLISANPKSNIISTTSGYAFDNANIL